MLKKLFGSMSTVMITAASMGMFMFSHNAFAADFGTEITIYDGLGSTGLGLYKEDDEVEPGMVQGQKWDLEGFFIKEKALTIVGGYNFYTGQDGMRSGDIFLDVDGDAVYSPNIIGSYDYDPGYNLISNSLFKYDYVFDVNWNAGTFDIVKLNADSILENTKFGEDYNKPSNPWIYISGGDVLFSQNFNNYSKASQSDTGFSGWNGNNKHYAATFDFSGINLPDDSTVIFHNTMECGNDNLIGMANFVGNPVPEPSSMLLGLMGMGSLIGFKRKNKQA